MAYLQARGLRLVARNWRCKGGELDLVLRERDTLVVTEVRKRSNALFGSAAESVDPRKQRRLALATQMFLAAHPEHARAPLRFDVVAMDGKGGIDWLRAAFDCSSM